MKTITELFHEHGTDKGWFHGYGPTYDALLTETTRIAINQVLELGVRDGSSLLTWRSAFPHAEVWGIDIAPISEGLTQQFHSQQIFFVQGDATEYEVIRRVSRAGAFDRFDLIIDDASHEIADQLASLLLLWPHLAPGGLYVIEDHLDSAHLYTLRHLPGATVSDVDLDKGGSLVVVRKP